MRRAFPFLSRARARISQAMVAASLSDSKPEFVELPRSVHPFFAATQAHPELKSRPTRAHPLFRAFLGAALEYNDAERLPVADRSCDLYTIAFGLRNVTRIGRALAEARRVLKPGGRFLCLEFTPAVTPLLQPLYDLYSFQVLPLLGQIVTGERDAYTYLVESIRRFPAQSELSELIAASGLDRVKFRNLTGGVAALHSAWRL